MQPLFCATTERKVKDIKDLTNELGNMTLELSLLSGTILLILLACLYTGLLMRDKFVLNQCCRMAASICARELVTECSALKECSITEEILLQDCQNSMLNTKIKDCSIQEISGGVEVICEGTFLLPFSQLIIWFGGEQRLQLRCKQKIPIWKLH